MKFETFISRLNSAVVNVLVAACSPSETEASLTLEA
jgi:hypothetical protein